MPDTVVMADLAAAMVVEAKALSMKTLLMAKSPDAKDSLKDQV
jgi:hypothetical protein